jgi:anti-sigma-K factor RskA
MSDIDIHHLGAAYALDALDERERAAFEAHYPACDVCRSDVLAFRETLTQLAAATATTPPAALKAAVMAEVAQTRQLSPLVPAMVSDLSEHHRRRQRMFGGVLALAAAVAAFVVGGIVMNGPGSPAYADDLAAILGQDDGRLVVLGAAAGAPGVVKVAWSETGDRAVLLGDGLPAAPDGEAYELWLIGADGPVPMSVLDPADDGRIRSAFDLGGAPHAWGVTMEPSAGSLSPTGEILYVTEV